MNGEEKNKRSIGSMGESIAAEYLSLQGFRLVERNYRFGRLGEIDIIAQENEYICFIEVKTRTSRAFGSPAEAVDWRKQRSLIKLAQVYMKQRGIKDRCVRFDVVEVLLDKKGGRIEPVNIHLIKNAFGEE